jgi:hypothetical protein
MEEYDDRFEATVRVHGAEVTLSIDKPVTEGERDLIVKRVEDNAELIWDRALRYFTSAKERYGIEHIDDLSDPQFLAGVDSLSLYWSSEKGDENGQAVIGVDFSLTDLEPIGLTIGD